MGLPEVKSSSIVQDNGRVSKRSNNFGVPVDMMDAFRAEWARSGVSTFSLVISPVLSLASAGKLEGELKITANRSMFSEFDNIFEDEFDVTCRPISFPPSDDNISSRLDPFMLRVSVSMIMVGAREFMSFGRVWPTFDDCWLKSVGIDWKSTVCSWNQF